jgi:hypothetical protein
MEALACPVGLGKAEQDAVEQERVNRNRNKL